MTKEIIFLKLGGSLITDKDKAYTPRLDKLTELALEIKTVLDSTPDLLLILGHGSGSFGHTAAKKYGTRDGVANHGAMAWLRRSPLSSCGVESLCDGIIDQCRCVCNSISAFIFDGFK